MRKHYSRSLSYGGAPLRDDQLYTYQYTLLVCPTTIFFLKDDGSRKRQKELWTIFFQVGVLILSRSQSKIYKKQTSTGESAKSVFDRNEESFIGKVIRFYHNSWFLNVILIQWFLTQQVSFLIHILHVDTDKIILRVKGLCIFICIFV